MGDKSRQPVDGFPDPYGLPAFLADRISVLVHQLNWFCDHGVSITILGWGMSLDLLQPEHNLLMVPDSLYSKITVGLTIGIPQLSHRIVATSIGFFFLGFRFGFSFSTRLLT